MITSDEAIKLSLENNNELKKILNTIQLLSQEGKTETEWIESDIHCVRLLIYLGYKVESVEGLGDIMIFVSW